MEQLEIKRLSPKAVVPTRATKESAGLDLYALLEESLVLEPGERCSVPTGIAVALPVATVGLVYGRSGLGIRHGVTLANAVGVIDSDYRGELVVGLVNHGVEPYRVEPGDRIAQLVVTPIFTPELIEVDTLPTTQREAGGFGSTGR